MNPNLKSIKRRTDYAKDSIKEALGYLPDSTRAATMAMINALTWLNMLNESTDLLKEEQAEGASHDAA